MRFILAVFALMLLSPLPAQAAGYTPVQTDLTALQQVGEGTVTEILRPDMLRVDGARVFVIDDIRVPPLFSDDAIQYLTAHVLNKKVRLLANANIGAGARDRMGNALAHVQLADDGSWLQAAMVGDGIAWADSTASNRDLIVPLQKIEDVARAMGRGFWAKPGMAVRTPETLAGATDSFQIVQGKVLNVADKDEVMFANFGPDWKTDFTIRIVKPDLANFPAAFRIENLKGKTLRVRGWVVERNGPAIDVTHAEQIEILPDDAALTSISAAGAARPADAAPEMAVPAPPPFAPQPLSPGSRKP